MEPTGTRFFECHFEPLSSIPKLPEPVSRMFQTPFLECSRERLQTPLRATTHPLNNTQTMVLIRNEHVRKIIYAGFLATGDGTGSPSLHSSFKRCLSHPVISLESKVGISTLQSPHRTLLVLALDCFCFFCFFVFIPETAMLNS